MFRLVSIANNIVCCNLQGIHTVENVYKDLGLIKIITLAPELKHALDVIKYLHERGIVVSLGKFITYLFYAKYNLLICTYLFI